MIGAMTYIGFDFGTKKIGVAIGSDDTRCSRPLTTVRMTRRGPDWDALDRLMRVWQPGAIVVGVPITHGDRASERALRCNRFGRRLAGRYRVPLHFVDESLTSKSAEGHLKDDGLNHGQRMLLRDQVAAQLILETFLHDQLP